MWIEGEPTGSVGAVCWKLMGAIVTGAGIVIGWLALRFNAKDKEITELHAARLQDRKDFEAQTNVMLKNLYRKKGEAANDS